ncbi:MAG: hypothetical protein ORN26_01950 [Candidatus Pacebacteria bacterium]|nr:hypothetical protein [Candidatus Paceibacterota bacterium]
MLSKKNIITISTFLLSAVLIFVFIFPLWTGQGYVLLDNKSIIALWDHNVQLDKDKEDLVDLKKKIDKILNDYNNIPQEKRQQIYNSLPKQVDNFRMLNDTMSIARRNHLYTELPGHSVDNSDSNIIIHTFTMSLKGNIYDFYRFLEELYISFPFYNYTSVSFTSDKKVIEGNSQDFSITFQAYQGK